MRTQENGWTFVTPSADSRIIYVSPSGSDLNPGTITSPKKTIGAAEALLRPGFPDHLLLECGGVWDGNFRNYGVGGRSYDEPLYFGSYGSGPRPIVRTGTSNGINFANYNQSQTQGWVVINGIEFYANRHNGSNSMPVGINVVGNIRGVLVEDCLLRSYCNNMVFTSNEGLLKDIQIRRTVSVDSFHVGQPENISHGLLCEGVDGLLLEECLFDHNGWNENVVGAVPTTMRHNVYIQAQNPGHPQFLMSCKNVVTKGCIVARAAANGLMQRAGGIAEDHLFLDNPINMVFGTTGGTINRCVCLDSHDINSANPRGVGFNCVNANPGARTILNNCICMWRTSSTTYNNGAYAPDSLLNPLELNNCIAWKWGSGLDVRNSPQPILRNCNIQGLPGAHDPAEARSIITYAQSMGWATTLASVMSELRKQSKYNWSVARMATTINAYIHSGWTNSAIRMVDFNGNGVADVGDFTAFLTAYAAAQQLPHSEQVLSRANFDGSTVGPVLNAADLTAFLKAFAVATSAQSQP